MSAFAAWLMGFAKSFLSWLYNDTIDGVQSAIDGFAAAAVNLISWVPAGPSVPVFSSSLPPSWAVFVNALNWFFPFGYFVIVFTFCCAGMLAYIFVAPVLRWFKLLT